MWQDWLYRFVVGAWALAARLTRGRLPFGVSFVPAQPAPSSRPQPSQDSPPSNGGAMNDVSKT